ncbi:hypothetical protein [Flagellimonas marinaquae]
MKPFFLLLTLFISHLVFSQKTYEFDHLLEYEVTYFKDSLRKNSRIFRKTDTTYIKKYLTYSQRNNYRAILTELDSLTFMMDFRDYEGVAFRFKILKSVFYENQLFKVPCELVEQYHNPFQYQVKNYDFVTLTDTIVGNKSYYRYKLTSIRPKKIKRLKLATQFYIVDKEAVEHMPLLDFPTAYEEWKTAPNLPNGLLFETHIIDFYGDLDSRERLTDSQTINKRFVINAPCDYSEN